MMPKFLGNGPMAVLSLEKRGRCSLDYGSTIQGKEIRDLAFNNKEAKLFERVVNKCKEDSVYMERLLRNFFDVPNFLCVGDLIGGYLVPYVTIEGYVKNKLEGNISIIVGINENTYSLLRLSDIFNVRVENLGEYEYYKKHKDIKSSQVIGNIYDKDIVHDKITILEALKGEISKDYSFIFERLRGI